MVDADKGLVQAVPSPGVARGGPAPTGFVAFYRAHYRTLLRTVMYTGASKHEAEDAVSVTMKEMLPRWPELINPLAFARRAVVSNFIKDRTRGIDRVRRRMVERGAAATGAGEDPRLTVSEGVEWVTQLLGTLPPGERDVLALIVDGYTPSEIAQRLGRSTAAVRQSLCNARRRLRPALSQSDQQPAGLTSHASRTEAR